MGLFELKDFIFFEFGIFYFYNREIAAAIKKKLDAVNNLFETMQSLEIKQILDIRKREFVKYSKQFSNTLKAYFRQGQ